MSGGNQDSRRARALVAAGRFEEAAATAARAAAAEPENAEPLCLLAQSLLSLGRNEEALDAAGRALLLDSDHEWALRLRSLACVRLKRGPEALEAALAASRVAPGSRHVLASLCRAQLACARFDEAEANATRLLEVAPRWAHAHATAGDVALARRRHSAAETHYRAALEIDPHDAVVVNNLGCALQRQRRRAEAMVQFEAAARLNPGLRTARSNLFSATWSRMIAGGVLGVYVLLRLTAASFSALPHTAVAVLPAVVGALALGGVAVWRRRRLTEVTRTFFDAELRRRRAGRKAAIAVGVLVALAVLSRVGGLGWAAGVAELLLFGAWVRYLLWPALRRRDDLGRPRFSIRVIGGAVLVGVVIGLGIALLFAALPQT